MGVRQRSAGLGPAFSALLTATFITNLGDGLRLAALPLLASNLTSSPLLIGGITAAQFLPWTTFAPFGGIIVDRSDRRRLIMATQAWRSLVMATLGIAVLADMVQVWHLFIVAYVITVGEILVDPSVVSTVPTLVSPRDLDRANGRITTIELVTNDFAGGPVGAASFALAPWLPFLLDSLSYLGSIAPFSRLPAHRSVDGQRRSQRNAPSHRARFRPTTYAEGSTRPDRHRLQNDHAHIVRSRRAAGWVRRQRNISSMVLRGRRLATPRGRPASLALFPARTRLMLLPSRPPENGLLARSTTSAA